MHTDPSPGACWRLAAVAAALLFACQSLAVSIPRDAYLAYVPLEYPRLVAQTQASARFHLYGDRDAPGYRDQDPVDGIDDRRAEVLASLAARFGPLLVQNTTDVPMDFRKFMEFTDTWRLYVDTWNTVGGSTLLRSDEIDLVGLARTPCPEPWPGTRDVSLEAGRARNDDCQLLALLDEFDPYQPRNPRLNCFVVENDADPFKVLFFDFPGEGPETWKQEYEEAFTGNLKREYRDYARVYAHPYVAEVRSNLDGSLGYAFVIQYFFFYPTNDGGNNHEGDWEHLNVNITPLSARHRLLTADEVRAILTEGVTYGGADDPLVIREIDYYFHTNHMTLDFTRPDAYAPRQQWQAEIDRLEHERSGARWLWRQIRYRTWLDDDETVINTHPVGFIGADNKGLDQVLAKPGGKNRDSHGTFPFTGLYKDVGPGGASEQIASTCDHRALYREYGDRFAPDDARFQRGNTVSFVAPDRIALVPDWERIRGAVREDPKARRDWFWMLLPIRWGYPATESPFAGVIGHAETGNLAPFGPHYQGGWNRSGVTSGFEEYDPHQFDSLFPMGLQDTFVNSWGFLNLTLPVLGILPPIDVAWRVGLLPFRAALGRQHPVFFPKDNIPFRFVSLGASRLEARLPEDTLGLLFTGKSGLELFARLNELDPEFLSASSSDDIIERPVTVGWQLNLFLGRRFASQNTLWHARSDLGFDIRSFNLDRTISVRSQLNSWELAGSLRYNLLLSDLQPYLKLGYGWTWYRVEDVTLDGAPLDVDDSPWFHQPSFDSLGDILPSSWHGGLGLEYIILRSYAELPRGIDIGVTFEATWTNYELGQDLLLTLLTADSLTGEAVKNVRVTRFNWMLGLTASF